MAEWNVKINSDTAAAFLTYDYIIRCNLRFAMYRRSQYRTGCMPVGNPDSTSADAKSYNSGGNMYLGLRKMIWYVGRATYSLPPVKHPLLFYVMPPVLSVQIAFTSLVTPIN
eukprot:8889406-Ditylum_brightwellii.AAC.2